MAKLPFSCAVTQTSNPDGSVTVTCVVTDGNGAQVTTFSETLGAGSTVGDVLRAIREGNRAAVGSYLAASDLPASFTVQLGLDTSLRNLDLL